MYSTNQKKRLTFLNSHDDEEFEPDTFSLIDHDSGGGPYDEIEIRVPEDGLPLNLTLYKWEMIISMPQSLNNVCSGFIREQEYDDKNDAYILVCDVMESS